LGERFLRRGAAPGAGKPVIWVHAVSVGETRAAQPLIEALAAEFPAASFVLTHNDADGSRRGSGCGGDSGGSPGASVTFPTISIALCGVSCRRRRPDVGIILETELWPALLFAARAAQVPMLLVNARLSEQSLARAKRWEALIRAAAQAMTRVAAQSEADRARIAQLYTGPIEVLGNLKFDLRRLRNS